MPDSASRSGSPRHTLKLSDYEINTLAAALDQILATGTHTIEAGQSLDARLLDSRELHTIRAIRTRLT